jgi:broad specificity polyphosphatase/5'/3'-nucleotidase SurE
VGVLSSLLIDGGTLPKGMLLNINHPLRKASDLEGWRMTKPAASFGGGLDYAWNADQSAVDVTFRFDGGQDFEPDSDAQALVEGALSITPLMADFALDDGLASRLTAVSEIQ